MDFDRFFGRPKLESDLFVQQSARDARRDLPFARSQSREPFLDVARFDPVLPQLDAPRRRLLDGIEQALLTDWLGQKIQRAESHRANRRRHIAVHAHQQHAERHIRPLEPRQQLESRAVRHAQVQEEAARPVQRTALLEFRRGCIGLHLPTVRVE